MPTDARDARARPTPRVGAGTSRVPPAQADRRTAVRVRPGDHVIPSFIRALMAEISLTQRAAVGVLQRHDLLVRPVEVVGDEGYLLVELVEGVA